MHPAWHFANRWLAWFHRWAGVALCLIFAVWFASGAVLHFVGFPALAPEDARALSEVIDTSRVRIDPAIVLARVPGASDLRLASVAGRPVFVTRNSSGTWAAVAADTGELLPPISTWAARSIAASFGRARAVSISGPIDYDQWVVHQHFDPYRPLYRVRLDDSDETDLYVSSRSGEVVQRTRSGERAWNWAGAVVHWIYFTPLRKSWSAWNQVVWWLSLAALLSSAAGTWLGLLRMIGNRVAGRPGLSPFRGWMRWHHIVGVFASVMVLTWISSGWLSMDHGRLFSRGDASPAQADRLRGIDVAAIARFASPAAISRIHPATSVDFNAIEGHAFLTAYGPTQAPRIFYLDKEPAAPQAALPTAQLESAVRSVWPAAVRSSVIGSSEVRSHDELYRRAESVPSDAAAFTVGNDLRVYVDRHSGRILAVMDSSRRTYAWIYYALHTLQFPFLIDHPPLRTAVVLTLLAVGFGFSITGIVLGVVRVRRDFA